MTSKNNQNNIERVIAYSDKEKQEYVLLKDLVKKNRSSYNKTGIQFGLTPDNQKFSLYLNDLGSIFIAGDSNSGKTTFLKTILSTLAFLNSPKELKFILATPKISEYKIITKSPYLQTLIISSAKGLSKQLDSLVEEMEKRYKLLARDNALNISFYNKYVKKTKIPYSILLIDDYSKLTKSLSNPARKHLEQNLITLISLARPTGILLVVATKEANTKALSGLLNVNFTARLAFRTKTKKDSRDIMHQRGCENLLGKGDAMLSYPEDGGIIHRLQTPYISDAELKKLLK